MNIPKLLFTDEWEVTFGTPPRTGTWIIWGSSGNGKSSFAMQLAKYLCRFGTVAYDSLEESIGLSYQNSLFRHRMEEVNGRFKTLDREGMDDLSKRLEKRRSPDFVIIDSLQYAGINYRKYQSMKEKHTNKTLIFVSRAEGDNPKGQTAVDIMYDADVKIFVQGFRAVCKGRFETKEGDHFTIWAERAAQYWNE